MKLTRITAALVATCCLAPLVPTSAHAEELPASLTPTFLGSTPSLFWQGRMPTVPQIRTLLGNTGSVGTGGWPEYRTAAIIGGGSFADAPGFTGKINGFWYDPSVTNGYVSAAVNIAAFTTAQEAVSAVALDAKAMGTAAKAVSAVGSLQRWQSVVTTPDYTDTIEWIVTGETTPSITRLICTVAGAKSLLKRCALPRVDALAQLIAMGGPPVAQLPAQVTADLPVTPAGLEPVLAVQQASAAGWGGLNPTKALRTAVAAGQSTVLQYAPVGTSQVAVSALITPLPIPKAAATFITEICNDAAAGTICKRQTLAKTASGIPIAGQLATTRKKGRVLYSAVQATGAGALVFINCENLRTFNALTTSEVALCQNAVPALLDAIMMRQQQ